MQAYVAGGRTNDTSDVTRRIAIKTLDAFFRRPVLYILPLAVLLVVGLTSVANTTREYRSVGTLSATTDSLLSEVAGVGTGAFSFETPASITSRRINELLRTRDFLERIATEIEPAFANGEFPLLPLVIQEAVSASADGENLVRVSALTTDPQVSMDIVSATITSYIDGEIQQRLTESNEAVSFFDEQVARAQEAADAAREELSSYLLANNPELSAEDRPALQTLEISRLTGLVDRAEEQVVLAQDKRDEAELTARTVQTQIQQQLRVVDQPEVPIWPEPRLRKAVMTVAMYGVLGLLVSGSMLAIATLLDRSVRLPSDVSARFEIDVLAVVPSKGRPPA